MQRINYKYKYSNNNITLQNFDLIMKIYENKTEKKTIKMQYLINFIYFINFYTLTIPKIHWQKATKSPVSSI